MIVSVNCTLLDFTMFLLSRRTSRAASHCLGSYVALDSMTGNGRLESSRFRNCKGPSSHITGIVGGTRFMLQTTVGSRSYHWGDGAVSIDPSAFAAGRVCVQCSSNYPPPSDRNSKL